MAAVPPSRCSKHVTNVVGVARSPRNDKQWMAFLTLASEPGLCWIEDLGSHHAAPWFAGGGRWHQHSGCCMPRHAALQGRTPFTGGGPMLEANMSRDMHGSLLATKHGQPSLLPPAGVAHDMALCSKVWTAGGPAALRRLRQAPAAQRGAGSVGEHGGTYAAQAEALNFPLACYLSQGDFWVALEKPYGQVVQDLRAGPLLHRVRSRGPSLAVPRGLACQRAGSEAPCRCSAAVRETGTPSAGASCCHAVALLRQHLAKGGRREAAAAGAEARAGGQAPQGQQQQGGLP